MIYLGYYYYYIFNNNNFVVMLIMSLIHEQFVDRGTWKAESTGTSRGDGLNLASTRHESCVWATVCIYYSLALLSKGGSYQVHDSSDLPHPQIYSLHASPAPFSAIMATCPCTINGIRVYAVLCPPQHNISQVPSLSSSWSRDDPFRPN